MHIIAHRGFWKDKGSQNSVESLELAFRHGWGVETDLRSCDGRLVISHDPINSHRESIDFERVLRKARESSLPIFANIKEDGLAPILEKSFDTSACIFFDMSTPQLFQFSKHFEKSQLATRLSDIEPTPVCLDGAAWIWVDCFRSELDIGAVIKTFPHHQLALVSPELHGREPGPFWHLLKQLNHTNLFLCTDNCLAADSFFNHRHF